MIQAPEIEPHITKHIRTLAKSKFNDEHQVTIICLTGGPCAGKSTALATL